MFRIKGREPCEKVRICLENKKKNQIFKNRITIGILLNVPPSNKVVAPEFFPQKNSRTGTSIKEDRVNYPRGLWMLPFIMRKTAILNIIC